MFTSPEQFANATKTLFDLQMQTFNVLASKTVKGVEQVVALNMNAARQGVDRTVETGRDLAQARTPQQAMETIKAGATPGMGPQGQYAAELKLIIDQMRDEFRQAADSHVAEAKSTLTALIYDLTQNVRPGSENAVDIIKSAIDNAFQGYEQVTQAARQALENVEAQIVRANEQVVPPAKPEQ